VHDSIHLFGGRDGYLVITKGSSVALKVFASGRFIDWSIVAGHLAPSIVTASVGSTRVRKQDILARTLLVYQKSVMLQEVR